uniref:Uncharacterized protein n=1 Tax=Myotis myotis TaxID=51298 RepID=A0A7J7TTT3_MYOMY|nr:hypothetical protein mMyoMyo1_008993 [Myotis myotis]
MRGPCEQHSLSEPRCGFEKRVGSSPAVGGREWAAHLRRTCPPPAPWRRGWRALSQLWSPQAPPCLLLTLPLLWEILSRSPLNRKGCQSGGLHPLTSLDRDVLRGPWQLSDNGWDQAPAAGTETSSEASLWHPGKASASSPTAPGTGPTACPSRPSCSRQDQPGHRLAFERMLEGCSPSRVPSLASCHLRVGVGRGQMRSCSEFERGVPVSGLRDRPASGWGPSS